MHGGGEQAAVTPNHEAAVPLLHCVESTQILEKRRHHRSNRYNSAPMPFMQRLNWYGVALHGGELPGYPASHGCIRLPMGFARHLFAATDVGTFVYVAREAIASPQAALELARVNAGRPTRPDRLPRGAAMAAGR